LHLALIGMHKIAQAYSVLKLNKLFGIDMLRNVGFANVIYFFFAFAFYVSKTHNV